MTEPLVWLIVAKTGPCLCGPNDDGEDGLFVFTTKEKAELFLKAKNLEETYEVGAEPQSAFAADLPRHFDAGFRHIWQDADADTGVHKRISVLSMMMELDARPGEERRK